MATTTNYGWTTPDDTALVKDGAAAIRTLGSSVDTTTKALNPSTTLGDIEYRSSTANTNTRLGIGTTGQVLTVSGGVPSWATPAGMTLINTGGTSLSSTATTISSIPSTYKSLFVIVKNVSVSSDCGTAFRLNTDTGNNYYKSSSAASEWGAGSASSTNTVAENNYGQLQLPGYTDAGTQFAVYNGYDSYNNTIQAFPAWYNKSATVSSITFRTDGISTFTNGTIWVYGV